MELIAQSFFNAAVIERYWSILLGGLGQTLLLSLLAIPLGVLFGILLGALGTNPNRLVRWFVSAYVDVLRSFPPLVLLILISTALPHLGLRPPPLLAIVIALLLNSSSYYGEIFRAGLLSVPAGAVLAARATGLSYLQTMVHVRLPIAIRNVLPDLLSNTLELVKLTSIAAVVTFVELTQAARIVQGLTFNATPIVAAAALYCLVLWPLARLVSRLEQRSLAK
jgi:polar amino acid transport system permease protein